MDDKTKIKPQAFTHNQPQAFHYLLIGSGRLATHLAFYFKHLNIQFSQWSRQDSFEKLDTLLSTKPVVILAISDKALDSFFTEHLQNLDLSVVHCSGSFHSNKMISCHPLMTFGKSLYVIGAYSKIQFAVTGISQLQDLFPALPNQSFQLKPENKALYHALCVISAAGVQTIWNQSEKKLAAMGIPETAFRVYIEQIAENYVASGSAALTGPWVRKDKSTVSKNLEALLESSKPLHDVYETLKEGFYDNT